LYDLNRQIDRYDMLWHAIGLEYSQSMQVNSDWIRGCLMSETTVTRCGNSSPNHVSPNHISLKTFHPIIGERTFHPILRFTQITIYPTHVSPKLHLLQSFTQFLLFLLHTLHMTLLSNSTPGPICLKFWLGKSGESWESSEIG